MIVSDFFIDQNGVHLELHPASGLQGPVDIREFTSPGDLSSAFLQVDTVKNFIIDCMGQIAQDQNLGRNEKRKNLVSLGNKAELILGAERKMHAMTLAGSIMKTVINSLKADNLLDAASNLDKRSQKELAAYAKSAYMEIMSNFRTFAKSAVFGRGNS